MGSFFNIEKLNEYIDTIPFDKFSQISNKKLSLLCCFGKSYSRSIETYGEKFTFDKAVRIVAIEELNALEDQFLGITGYKRGQYLVKTSPNWHNDSLMDYWGIRSHLIYQDELTSKAREFIKANLNENYIAVHWRRGDRSHPEMGKVREETVESEKEMKARLDHYLIKPVQKILKRYGINKVFLATNSGTQWHIDYLKERLPIVQYPHSYSWKNLEFDSVIEQLICAESFYYISSPYTYTRCSSFSRWIVDSRKLIGKAGRVMYMQKMESIQGKKLRLFMFYLLDLTRPLRGKLGLRMINFKKDKLKMTEKSARTTKESIPSDIMCGILFDDKIVTLDRRSIDVGGSWYPYRDNIAQAWDPKMIHLVYDQLKQHNSPVMFDIGANTGSFSLLALFHKSMKVYAFEPQPFIYEILNENIRLNKLEKEVIPFTLALLDKNGIDSLHTPKEKNASGLATLGIPKRFSDSDTVEINIAKLDDFARQNNIRNVMFIKIDTEGAELLVLKGGEKFIREHMPTMLIEYNKCNTMQFGYDQKEILHLLLSWGYEILWVAPEDILCVKKYKTL